MPESFVLTDEEIKERVGELKKKANSLLDERISLSNKIEIAVIKAVQEAERRVRKEYELEYHAVSSKLETVQKEIKALQRLCLHNVKTGPHVYWNGRHINWTCFTCGFVHSERPPRSEAHP